MFWSRVMSQYEPLIPIQHIWVKKHLVAVFGENIGLLNFIPHLSRVDTYQPTITIFIYIILIKGVPLLAPKNNTLEIREIHFNGLLYLSDVPNVPRTRFWSRWLDQLDWSNSTSTPQSCVMFPKSTFSVRKWCPYAHIDGNKWTYYKKVKKIIVPCVL